MKKTTLLFLFLIASFSWSYGQCIRNNQYPSETISSNNIGLSQTITMGAYSTEYSKLDNLIIGLDYVFTCTSDDVPKFITVTDWSNNVIAFGTSPLTVPAISSASVHLHYADDSECNSGFTTNMVTIQAILTCPPPSVISIAGITTTGANFSWTPQGTETSWQTLILANDAPEPTASTVGTTTSTTTASTNDLTPNTPYKFYVRSNCATELSPWNGPKNFTTSCIAVSTLNESFENTPVDEVPSCWTAVLTPGNASIGVSESGAVSGTKSLALNNSFSAPGAVIMLVSPNLNNVNAGTHRVKFFAETWEAATLQVGTVDNATNEGYFTSLEEFTLTNVNNEYTVDFSTYAGTDTYIAFKNTSEDAYSSIFLDDIRWELLPLCADVTDITINAVTATTTSLTWASDGNETQWEVVYGLSTVNDPTTLTPIVPLVNNLTETTINGLTANTQYNVWVRSVCGGTDGNGAWIGPKKFTTSCIATATFQENFDDTAEGAFPDCWSSVVSGTSGFGPGVYIYSYGGHSGPNAMQLNNGASDVNATIMLISPALSTLTTSSHRVKFFAKGTNPGQTLEVGTINSPNATGYFSSYQTIDLTTTYQEFTVDFSDYAGTDTYIAFRHPSLDIYSSILIDDVRWELTPLCNDVTNLTATALSTGTATITWDAVGSETAWDVVYGASSITDPTTLTPITPAVTDLAETTITGLTDNTDYNIWVRSSCGGTDGVGAWIGPLNIHTTCFDTDLINENFETIGFGQLPNCFSTFINGPTVDMFASVYGVEFNGNSGSNAVQLFNGESSNTTDYVALVLPNLSTVSTATHRLKFHARTDYGPGGVSVGTLDGITSTATFSTYEEHVIDENYSQFVVEFTNYVGTDNIVAIRNTSNQYVSVFIDDIIWEVAPLCADVADIEINAITTTSAAVQWNQQGSETQWDVVIGSADVTDPTTLTPIAPLVSNNPNTTLFSLTANTTYNVWVRSVCGGTDGNGVWMGPISFTTLCNPTTLPYTQDFETANVPSLPGCSTVENLGTGNAWATEEVYNYGFEGKVLLYNFTCQAPADTWFYTQGITLTAGTTYSISYKYAMNNANYVEKMKVAYGTSPDFDGMTEQLADHPTINFTTAETNVVTFTPTVSSTYYFGFNAYSDSCQYYLYVDDIVIDTALSTPNVAITKATLYPNPVKDVLNISHAETITNVSIYNVLGQKVIDKNYNATQVQLNLSDLPSGSYIVKSTINNQVNTTTILKQ
jgi:hypothetical protein